MQTLPHPNAETRPFWDACHRGTLTYQVCASCHAVQRIPRSVCAGCQSRDLQWRDSSGYGRVVSFTEVHRAPTPAFRAQAPYVIVLVDMQEGFRLMANLQRSTAELPQVGQGVRVTFREVEGMSLPQVQLTA